MLTGLLESALGNSTAEGPAAFVQQPPNTAQTFLDLNAELEAVFGAGGGGQLATPDSVRAALGAPADADLAALLAKAPGAGPCPWPPLDSLRGKIFPILILEGGSPEAAAFQEAFPASLQGSLAWTEQSGRAPLPGAVFRSAAIRRITDSSLTLALAADAPTQVR